MRRLINRFRSNLSLKLISAFVIGSIVFLMMLGSVAEYGFENHFRQRVHPLVSHYIDTLHHSIGNPPQSETAKALTDRWPLVIRIFGPDHQWASDNRLIRPHPQHKRRDQRRGDKPLAHKQSLEKRNQQVPKFALHRDRAKRFLMRTAGEYQVYYGINIRPAARSWWPLVLAAIVFGGLYLFYRLIRWIFSPIKTIREGVEKIGSGQLGYRIATKSSDELGDLANNINKMASDLEKMMQAKRDLLLSISHELRSPLARSRVSLALLDDSETKGDLLNDQLEMERLINNILDAERLHDDHAIVHRSPTDIYALIHQVVDQQFPDATIELGFPDKALTVAIDPTQIERLLRNLIENALRYNRDTLGQVQINCRHDQPLLVLEVIDHGTGIDPQHVERIGDAFYRPDPSRDRKSGGLGLGLYLCQAIVKAHGGSMRFDSSTAGTRIICNIPA